jgi:hypothetical protein
MVAAAPTPLSISHLSYKLPHYTTLQTPTSEFSFVESAAMGENHIFTRHYVTPEICPRLDHMCAIGLFLKRERLILFSLLRRRRVCRSSGFCERWDAGAVWVSWEAARRSLHCNWEEAICIMGVVSRDHSSRCISRRALFVSWRRTEERRSATGATRRRVHESATPTAPTHALGTVRLADDCGQRQVRASKVFCTELQKLTLCLRKYLVLNLPLDGTTWVYCTICLLFDL